MSAATPGPCRFCRGTDVKPWNDPVFADDAAPWSVVCQNLDCSAEGPRRATEAEAIVAWGVETTDAPLYYARDGLVWKRPIETRWPEGGGSTFTLGFPVCKLHEACAGQEEIVAAILNRGELATNLLSALTELLAADDAMSAFLIGADLSKIGREEWGRQHAERSVRRKAALDAARAIVAKAESRS